MEKATKTCKCVDEEIYNCVSIHANFKDTITTFSDYTNGLLHTSYKVYSIVCMRSYRYAQAVLFHLLSYYIG